MGREFILKATQYCTSIKIHFLMPTILRIDPMESPLEKLIGWEKNPQDERAIIEEIIRKNYLGKPAASTTKAGAVEISVTLSNPS